VGRVRRERQTIFGAMFDRLRDWRGSAVHWRIFGAMSPLCRLRNCARERSALQVKQITDAHAQTKKTYHRSHRKISSMFACMRRAVLPLIVKKGSTAMDHDCLHLTTVGHWNQSPQRTRVITILLV